MRCAVLIASLLGYSSGGALPGVFQLPNFITDVQELFGIQIQHVPRNARAVTAAVAPAAKDGKLTGQGEATAAGQSVLMTDGYEVNANGQFATPEAMSQALQDQLGVPPNIADQIATHYLVFGNELLTLNAAIGAWLQQLEEEIPDATVLAQPLLAGIAAFFAAIPSPTSPTDGAILAGLVESLATTINYTLRVPAELALEAHRSGLAAANQLIEALSPIALDPALVGEVIAADQEAEAEI